MIRWTASRINAANYCRMRYYLRYIDPSKPKPLRLSAYVKGSLLHVFIQNFWKNLGTPEETASASKKFKDKKYFSAESFSKYAQGKWTSIIIADEESPNKIDWRNKEEKWFIRAILPKICSPLFYFLKEEGPPLFAEKSINVILNGKRYYGILDEIRKKEDKIIIRDYKSGSPWVGEMKLKHDPQLTFYNFLVCSLAKQNKEFAEKLGLEEKITEKFMGNPFYINPDFEMQFSMIEALAIDSNSQKIKTPPKMIISTQRTDENYLELVKMIDGTKESIETGNIYPERGRKCDSCDMSVACDKKLDDVNSGRLIDKRGQLFFSFAFPNFVKKEEFVKDKSQKRFSFRYGA
ncbi:MAG: PD-(D/E)XK nuclease family protein [Nanoarchaeota archaeon]